MYIQNIKKDQHAAGLCFAPPAGQLSNQMIEDLILFTDLPV